MSTALMPPVKPPVDNGLEQKFQKLFQDGKLVQVHVSKWGMGYQLEEKDLNLKEGEILPDFFKLGKKMLIEDSVRLAFQRVEARARNFLRDNSYKFPIADAHFVTSKKIIKVLEELNKVKAEYDALTADFCNKYEDHKKAMLEKYKGHQEKLTPFYPSLENVRKKFAFSVTVFEVGFPKRLKSLNLEELQAKNQAVAEAKTKYEEQMDAQYKNSLKQMDEFVAEAAKALRSQVVEVFEGIADKLKRREVITPRNVQAIRILTEEFDALNFFDDKVVKEKLDTVRALVNSDADFRDNHKAIMKLQTAVTEVLKSTKDITDVDSLTGSYYRRIELNDHL